MRASISALNGRSPSLAPRLRSAIFARISAASASLISPDSTDVAAAIAAEPPANNVPVRSIGATHLIFIRRTISQLPYVSLCTEQSVLNQHESNIRGL